MNKFPNRPVLICRICGKDYQYIYKDNDGVCLYCKTLNEAKIDTKKAKLNNQEFAKNWKKKHEK
jgi:hypothetical protein